jgi:ribose transport system permease protein
MTDQPRLAAERPVTFVDPLRRNITLTFGVAALLFLVGGAIEPGFLRPVNVFTVLVVASFIGFVAAGQSLVILTGGIDLSVAWVINAGGVMLTSLAAGSNLNAVWVVPATLGMGMAVGAANGLGIVFLEVPPVVMTLGMNGIMQGLVLGLTNGFTSSSAKAYAPSDVSRVVNGALPGGIPIDLALWAVVALGLWVILSRLAFGRWVYALGNNPVAAYLAGGSTRRITVTVYALAGGFSALTGIILVGYAGQATLGAGDPYLFASIAAVVIGGTSILGGRGHYLGTIAGAIILTVLTNVLTLLSIPEAGRSVLYGLAILIALLIYGRQPEDA